MSSDGSIGIFDSGVGGLAIYKALATGLPHENFIYLGDTARLPYGTKSPERVTEYTLQAAEALLREDIKLLVIACNTASAQALIALQETYPALPCIGMIEPSAREAARISHSGRIGVMATEGTVRSGAYVAVIKRLRPDAEIKMQACGLLVSMAEEGHCEGSEVETVIGNYLRELGYDFDTLVLGCTHFLLMAPAVRKLVGSSVHVVDSAVVTARAVNEILIGEKLLNQSTTPGKRRFLVTNAPERFRKLACYFMGTDITPEDVALTVYKG